MIAHVPSMEYISISLRADGIEEKSLWVDGTEEKIVHVQVLLLHVLSFVVHVSQLRWMMTD